MIDIQKKIIEFIFKNKSYASEMLYKDNNITNIRNIEK